MNLIVHNMLVYLKESLPRIQSFFFILTLKKLLFDEMGVGSFGRDRINKDILHPGEGRISRGRIYLYTSLRSC